VAAATALAIVVASFRLGGAFARRFLEGSGGKTVGLQPLKGENNDVNGHQPPHHDHHHLMRGGAEDDNQHTHQPANNQKQVVKPHHREDHWDLQHELASLRAELEAKERELEQIVNARNQQQQQQADKEGSLAAAAPHKSADPNDAIPLDHKFKLASLIKTTAYDLYGMDNHEVEFHVRYYPDAKSQEPVDGVFFAEIADFETTPLSSFLFLEQVNHGLWDDTSFPVNAPHMLLAQPTSVYSIRNHTLVESNTVAPRRSRLPEMQALGLDRLPIMEYEDDFGKHSKYTIGFGGSSSSAGSYFFINKADNTRAHENQACFGNIIEGVDVIENIFSLQDHDANFKLRRPVEIVSARVIPHRDNHEHDHDEEGGEGDHHDHHAEHADHHDELHDHTRDHAQHDEHHEHRLDHHDAGHDLHHEQPHDLHHNSAVETH
jgi:cyclophilin family peptidyl-prolyl cis-trans isomerase